MYGLFYKSPIAFSLGIHISKAIVNIASNRVRCIFARIRSRVDASLGPKSNKNLKTIVVTLTFNPAQLEELGRSISDMREGVKS